MTAAPADDLTDLRLTLHRNAYRPVPVLGPHVATKAAGKRPAMKSWEAVCATADEAEITRWTNAQRNCTNTGLLCGTLIGIDIDVLDAGHASRLTGMATDMLGPSHLSRIGRAPKILLAFRTDVPFDKVQTSEFQMLDGTVARVEVLATGQQFVGFGIHPDTKASYHWPERSPLDVPLHDLPSVNRDGCAAFIGAAEDYLRKVGGQTTSERRVMDREGRKLAGLKPKEAPSHELIAEAVAHIPNNDLPYDEWIKVGLALYAALGPEGRDLWDVWSAEAMKNDPAHSAEKWDSFSSVRNVTVGTLFWLAKQNGWRAAQPRRVRTAHTSRDAGDETATQGNRPLVRVRAGQMPETIDEAEEALIGAGLGFYQRGSIVVRPAMVPVAISGGRQIDAPRLVHVKAHHMAEAFTKAAHWERFDMRAGDWVNTDCSQRLAETYLAREGQWRLPVLTGIINAPTLREDGSILDQPGYDAQTGLLFDPQGERFPLLPREPDRGTALRALGFLRDLIGSFPFVTPADRSVALSAILTTLFRRSLPTAPLHGFNAPAAGTGKSMLVDLASIIATSRPAPVIAQGKSEEEMEKRLGSALIAGDVMIAIDNCEEPLGGELLCQTMTQTSLKVRILGSSINAEVPSNATVFATGNNLTLAGDMTRRAIRATLDAGVERPEMRAFDRDPLAMAAAHRGDYVTAGLTILRAFHIAGRPSQTVPLGSFTAWSGWVTAPGDGRTAGFHLSSLYSPWETWAEIAQEHARVAKDPARLQVWVNTKLGESWEDQAGDTVPADPLMARREDWGSDLAPGVAALTAGVDVQGDRIEVQIVGWGRDEEAWVIDYRVLWGDPSGPRLWSDLDGVLNGTYGDLPVRAVAVDTGGHHTKMAYEFCRTRLARRIWAIKGRGGPGIPVWPRRPTRSNKAKIPLFIVGVDAVKDAVYARLKLTEPGPGAIHFPHRLDADYFRQLTAERVVTRFEKGRPIRSWQPKRDGERNEALDTFVYAHAALHGLISMGMRLNEEAVGMSGRLALSLGASAGIIRSTWMG